MSEPTRLFKGERVTIGGRVLEVVEAGQHSQGTDKPKIYVDVVDVTDQSGESKG